jgi:DNA-binding CsgD family transcriptional regulator/tetratricopeptide (TPR) repeat protein
VEVGACASAVHGSPLPNTAIHEIFRRSGGNPFFVVEIARDLPERGAAHLPRTVVEMIHGRLAGLPAESKRTLQVAAVLGEEFDGELVGAVEAQAATTAGPSGPSPLPGNAADRLRPALDDHLIAPLAAGHPQRFRFLHALVREAVYATLDSSEARTLHRGAGAALARRWAADLDPVLPELVHHFAQVGEGEATQRAIGYARRAAAQAERRLAFEDAVPLYERAIELVRREEAHGRHPIEPTDVLALRLRLGWALESSGNREAARRVYRDVVDAARHLGAVSVQGQATLGVAGWLALTYGEVGTVTAALQEAERALGPADSVLRACLLARLSMELAWLNAPGYVERAEEAVAVARRVGDPGALTWAMHALHSVVSACQRIPELLALADETLARAGGGRYVEGELLVRRWRVYDYLVLGDAANADAELAAYTELARPQRSALHDWSAESYAGLRALLDGRFSAAMAHAERAHERGQRLHHIIIEAGFIAQVHTIQRGRGGLEPMFAAATQAYVEDHPHHVTARCILAQMHAAAGNADGARQILAYCAANDFADILTHPDWLLCVAHLADASAAIGDATHAPRLYERLLPQAGYMVVANPSVVYASVHYYLGRLAAVMARWDAAVCHLEQALEEHRRLRARPLVVHAQYALARALAARGASGDRDTARALLARAAATADLLGMRPLAVAIAATVAARSDRTPTRAAGDGRLERVPLAVFLVDVDGHVRQANRRAMEIVAEADGLRVEADRLGTGDVHSDLLLQRLLCEVAEEAGAGGYLALLRPSGRRPLGALITAPDPRIFDGVAGAVAAVYLTDPERPSPPLYDAVIGLYGLTAAEARLAVLLATGVRVDAAAAQLGISVHTARTQLKRTLRKTETHRQADLVRLLLATSAFPTATNQS